MRDNLDELTTAVLMTFTMGDVIAILGMLGAVALVWWQVFSFASRRLDAMRESLFLELTSLRKRIDDVSDMCVKRPDLDRDLANLENTVKGMRSDMNTRFDLLVSALKRPPTP